MTDVCIKVGKFIWPDVWEI